MADPVWLLTDEDGFTLELPLQFKPANYVPSTGGQSALYRSYGNTKVYQASDSIGMPQAIQLSALVYDKDETKLGDQIEVYAKMVKKAAAITRTDSPLGTVQLIPGASYIETEVQPKAKRVRLVLVLIPKEIVNVLSIWGS